MSKELDAHAARIANGDDEMFANITGRFWLPCPLCGQGFGGHQTGHGAAIYNHPKCREPYIGLVVCPDCVDAANQWNADHPLRTLSMLAAREGEVL